MGKPVEEGDMDLRRGGRKISMPNHPYCKHRENGACHAGMPPMGKEGFAMGQLFASFIAFNINGFNYMVYQATSNFYVLIMIACAVASAVVNLREVMEEYVVEEQNIL